MAKFLTLNTHSWLDEDALTRLKVLGDKIITEGYDVIALQEVNQLITEKEANHPKTYVAVANKHALHADNYALKLVEYLKTKGVTYYFTWVYNHIGYDKYHEGVALLSKEPFTKVQKVLTSDVDDEHDYHTRYALIGQTKIAGQPVTAVCGHFSWWENGFLAEWERLEESLGELDAPYVVMGDFNNPVDSKGHERVLVSPLGLVDSHQVAKSVLGQATIEKGIDGWEENQSELKIDFIFLSKSFDVLESQIVFDGQNEAKISDHFGVACVTK